jgi:hypothetical protein
MGQGWSGALYRVKDIKITGQESSLGKTFILKYCRNVNHSYQRMDEVNVLSSIGPQFASPLFPKPYLVIKDGSGSQ